MRNPKYFEEISKVHDGLPQIQMLNLVLGAYNEVAALEQRVNQLEQKIFAAALKSGIVSNEDQNVTTEDSTVAAAPEENVEVM